MIIFQLLSCGGINVSDIPLENVAEHKKLINENIEDKEALEKAYVELSEENLQVWESPYIYYYLSLIYKGEYESLFDLDPLESGLALFPNDPFLNYMKVNMDDNLDSKLEGYKNILENHPRFYLALGNFNFVYTKYWNALEDDKDIILEKERVQNLLGVVNLYESGDNNTSEYYNFNEIFSDTIAYNLNQFEIIKSNFEGFAVYIEDVEKRERERIREQEERRIAARNRFITCFNDSEWIGRVPNFPSVSSDFTFYSDKTFSYYTSMFGGMRSRGNWSFVNFDKRQIKLSYTYNSGGYNLDDVIINVNSSCSTFSIGSSVYRKAN